jgi:hypothetical protein
MAEVEKVSGNALIVFETFRQLMALPYIEQVMIESERYTVLYQKMILSQIPHFIKSKRTLSRSISELVDAGLIKSNGNNMLPAYTFTDKGLSYITSNAKNELQESVVKNNKIRKKPILSLLKKTRLEDLKQEYLEILSERSRVMSQKHKVPFSEFDIFLEHHSKNGNKFANWLSAYSTWCRNYKKYHTNDGENGTRGLYA